MRAVSLLLSVLLPGASPVAGADADEVTAVEVYARGDYAAAVRLLEPLYQAGKARIQDRLLLARAYLHLDRSEEALTALRSVLKSDAENPEANALIGRTLQQAGKHAEALEYLQRAQRLKQDPATAGALGQCHYALGHVSKAKVYLAKALQADIRDPANSFLLGKICLSRGLGALAEKYLLMAEEAGLDKPELHLLLGKAYLLQHKQVGPILARTLPRPAKPGEIIDGLVVLAPVEGVANRYKVCTRYSALHEGYRLLQGDPDNPDGLFMLAAGWFAAGRNDLARKYLSALAERESGTERLTRLRAEMAVAAKDFADLRRILTDAAARKVLGPAMMARLYYRAAVVLRAQGQSAEAIALLQQAERLAPTSEQVLRALGELYLAAGRRKEARQYYGRMVELFPDARDIDRLRNTLKVLKEKTGGQR